MTSSEKLKFKILKIRDCQAVVHMIVVTFHNDILDVLFNRLGVTAFQAEWLLQIPRNVPGYISETVDSRCLRMPPTTSGHKRTLKTSFGQNQNWSGVRHWSIYRGTILQASIVIEIVAIFCENSPILRKFDLLTPCDLKFDLIKTWSQYFCRTFHGLSNTVYRLSLSFFVFEFSGGGVIRPRSCEGGSDPRPCAG